MLIYYNTNNLIKSNYIFNEKIYKYLIKLDKNGYIILGIEENVDIRKNNNIANFIRKGIKFK